MGEIIDIVTKISYEGEVEKLDLIISKLEKIKKLTEEIKDIGANVNINVTTH